MPIHEDGESFEDDLESLAARISRMLPVGAAPRAKAHGDGGAAVCDTKARDTLDKVRQELAAAKAGPTAEEGPVAGRALAQLPAEVPSLGDNTKASAEMAQLRKMLTAGGAGRPADKLEVCSQSARVGAHGMGGNSSSSLETLDPCLGSRSVDIAYY